MAEMSRREGGPHATLASTGRREGQSSEAVATHARRRVVPTSARACVPHAVCLAPSGTLTGINEMSGSTTYRGNDASAPLKPAGGRQNSVIAASNDTSSFSLTLILYTINSVGRSIVVGAICRPNRC